MRRAALALAAIALTACGSPPAPPAPPAPAGPATVVYPMPAPVPATTAPTATWTMPNLVGSGLQDAQDAIQQLTDYGIAVTTSHDATGAGRMQVSDRNWTVCGQNVPPGDPITPSTRIDFGVVKVDESC